MIDFELELFMSATSTHHLKRYLEFVLRYKDVEVGGLIEKHHILPKSMFPQYKNDKDNIILLPVRAHYLAHWMLAKAVGGKMWQAFYVMTCGRKFKFNSRLYSLGKQRAIPLMSELSKSMMNFVHQDGEREAIKRGRKTSKTKRTIRDCGTSIGQEASTKAAITMARLLSNGSTIRQMATEQMGITKTGNGAYVSAGRKHSTRMLQKDSDGLSVAHYVNVKRGVTLNNTIDEASGKTKMQLTMENREITMSAKIHGVSIRDIAGRKISHHLNSIEPNGKTVAQNRSIQTSKTIVENGSLRGNKNGRALHIQIYDENSELVYNCDGTFVATCDEHKLPRKLLTTSLKQDGSPIERTAYGLIQLHKQNLPTYEGWFAIKVPSSP